MSQLAGVIRLYGDVTVLSEIAELWRLESIYLLEKVELDSAYYYRDMYYRLAALLDAYQANPYGSPLSPLVLEELQTVPHGR